MGKKKNKEILSESWEIGKYLKVLNNSPVELIFFWENESEDLAFAIGREHLEEFLILCRSKNNKASILNFDTEIKDGKLIFTPLN